MALIHFDSISLHRCFVCGFSCREMSKTQYCYCGSASIPLSCPCSLFSFTLGLPLTRADEWLQLCTLTHQDPITAKQTTSGFPVKGFQLTSDVCKKKMSIYAWFLPLLVYLLQDFIHTIVYTERVQMEKAVKFQSGLFTALLFDSNNYMWQNSSCLNLGFLAFLQNVLL